MSGRPLPAASGPRAPGRLTRARRTGLGLLLAALLVGCTGGATPTAGPPVTGPTPVGAAATTSRGAELRAALTWLLTERVHLVLDHARALGAAAGERDDPLVLDARVALATSTSTTADTLGGSYTGGRAQLLPGLQAHSRAALDHSAATVAADGAAAQQALGALAAARAEVATAVRRVVPGLRSRDVEDALAGGDGALVSAVQAAVEGSPRAPALQRAADEAAWSTARLLSVGVSTDRGLGPAGSQAPELRGRLTGLLTEHVLLAGELAVHLRAAGGALDDPQVLAIEAALDAVAVSLAELVGRTAPESALPVLTTWREHVRELRDRAAALAAGRPAPPPARPALDRLQAALTPYADALPPNAAERAAQAAASLQAALDAAATRQPTAPEALRTAAADTVAPAALVAAALAEALQLS